MSVMDRVRKEFGNYVCRRCLNEVYHAKLEPVNCEYGYFYTCPRCHENHHIVVGLKMSGHGKLLFR